MSFQRPSFVIVIETDNRTQGLRDLYEYKVLLRFPDSSVQMLVRHIPAPDARAAVIKALHMYPQSVLKGVEFDAPESPKGEVR